MSSFLCPLQFRLRNLQVRAEVARPQQDYKCAANDNRTTSTKGEHVFLCMASCHNVHSANTTLLRLKHRSRLLTAGCECCSSILMHAAVLAQCWRPYHEKTLRRHSTQHDAQAEASEGYSEELRPSIAMAIARTCLETYLAATLCIWISLDAEKLSSRTSASWQSALATSAPL